VLVVCRRGLCLRDDKSAIVQQLWNLSPHTEREFACVQRERGMRERGLAFKNSGFLQQSWKFVCAALAVLLCPTPRLIVTSAQRAANFKQAV